MLWAALLLCVGHSVLSSVNLWPAWNKAARNGSAYRHGRLADYLVFEGQRHAFPDRFTLMGYGFSDVLPTRLPDFENVLAMPIGEPLDTLWHSDVPNMVMRSILQNSSYQQLILDKVDVLTGFSNAGLLYRSKQRDWLVKIAPRPAGAAYNQFLGEIDFRIVLVTSSPSNVTSLSKDLQEGVKWLTNSSTSIDDWTGATPSVATFDLGGSDCRLLEMTDGRIFMTYSRQRKGSDIKPFFTELLFPLGANSRLALAREDDVECNLEVPGHPNLSHRDQKNWVMFGNNTLLFVAQIWPFNVVIVDKFVPGKSWIGFARPFNGHWVHQVPTGLQLPWKFGNPHGSTSTVKLHNGEYLAFFHSYKELGPEKVTKTYAMGAFTFCAHHDGSFRLSSISTVPIIQQDMYAGRWYHDKRLWGYVDYAVFPTSLILEGDFAFVLYAYQNARNSIVKFNLTVLLHSLQKIAY